MPEDLDLNKDYDREMKEKIKSLARAHKNDLKYIKEFNKVSELPFTKFVQNTITLLMRSEIMDIDNNILFNSIKTNLDMPFASFNNLYKILRYFDPFESWENSNDDFIGLRFLYGALKNITIQLRKLKIIG